MNLVTEFIMSLKIVSAISVRNALKLIAKLWTNNKNSKLPPTSRRAVCRLLACSYYMTDSDFSMFSEWLPIDADLISFHVWTAQNSIKFDNIKFV